MAITANQIIPTISPAVDQFFSAAWIIMQLVIVLSFLAYGIILYRFNIRVTIREYTKGGRVIAFTTKAKEFVDRKNQIPRLQLFGFMGFAGVILNQPPNECIVPYKGLFAKKLYDFIKKDGMYHPIQNLVLGRRYDVPLIATNKIQEDHINGALKEADSLLKTYEVNNTDSDVEVFYSLDGSGLEVNRDYEAEQAIENIIITKAENFRNQKPSVLYAMYGLAIILAIGSFITLIYSWNQFGNMADAIAGLGQPLKQGVEAALNQQLGP